MHQRCVRQALMGLAFLFVARAVAGAAGALPPPRPPRVKLTLKGDATKGKRIEVYEGRRVLRDEDSYPRRPAALVQGPTVARRGAQVVISFALDKPDDVLVRVVDAKGNTVRNLACGVLGPNAPQPFTRGSLRQEIVWDGTDAHGKPAPPGSRARVAVGLTPRLDRFVAHRPTQIANHVVGLEVDPKGRLYVALFTDRRGDPHLVRYDRQGNYLDACYPPNPNNLAGTLRSVYKWVDTVDGRQVPMRFGGAWPFTIYKYHTATESDPSRYPFPLRIAPNGLAFIAETQMASHHSQLVTADYKAAGPLQARILPVQLDPFWFLEGMTMGLGPWAIDAKGYAYLCRDGVIVKATTLPVTPVESFAYNGTDKLPKPRHTLGARKQRGKAHDRLFELIQDITIGPHGTLYVVDSHRLKILRPDGQLVTTLEQFDLDGTTRPIGSVHGVRATADALYVVARIDPAGGTAWARAQLVKFRLAPGPKLQALWWVPLSKLAGLVAVDNHVTPHIVWVGNGGGPATFTRIVDLGNEPGEVRHCGSGIRKGTLIDPWALALDAKGRLFVFDYARGAIVRTSDDGSEWLETPTRRVKAMLVDRTRGRLFACRNRQLLCLDLDFNQHAAFRPTGINGRYGVNLGAVDAEGNLYVSDVKKGEKLRNIQPGLHGLVRVYAPDGSVKNEALCQTYLADAGLARDSKGCIYVTDTARMGFMDAVHNWSVRRGPKWQRGGKEIRCQSHLAYLVKFPPTGGTRGTDAELWAHRGVSPVMGGGCACPVPTNCVAIDGADRIFAADYQLYHVKALDTAGNLIARIGAWGGADCRGPKSRYPDPEIAFAWVHSIDTFGDYLYASDKDLRRVAKIRMDYRHTKEAAIP